MFKRFFIRIAIVAEASFVFGLRNWVSLVSRPDSTAGISLGHGITPPIPFPFSRLMNKQSLNILVNTTCDGSGFISVSSNFC